MHTIGVCLFVVGFLFLRLDRRRASKKTMEALYAALHFVRYTEEQIAFCRTSRQSLLQSEAYQKVSLYDLTPAARDLFTAFVDALGTQNSSGELARCQRCAAALESQAERFAARERTAAGSGNALYVILGLGLLLILW